jgi:hypothetical protein
VLNWLAASKQSEDQDPSSSQQTETGQPQQSIALDPVHPGDFDRICLVSSLQREEAGPLLVLELAIMQGPEKDQNADYETRKHVGQKVWVIHEKSKAQGSRPEAQGSMVFPCALRLAPCATSLGFPGRVYAPGFLVSITLVYEVHCHIVPHFPDLLRFQISLKIGHGGTGDAIHDLVVENAAGNFPPMENSKVERWRIEMWLSRAHAVSDGSVAAEAELLINHVPSGQPRLRGWIRVG